MPEREGVLYPLPLELAHPPLMAAKDDPYAGDVRRAIEMAYRRGFMQGAHEATRRVRDPRVMPKDYNTWVFDEIIEWRYRWHYGACECPPMLEYDNDDFIQPGDLGLPV